LPIPSVPSVLGMLLAERRPSTAAVWELAMRISRGW
jgi:hypothetical protein